MVGHKSICWDYVSTFYAIKMCNFFDDIKKNSLFFYDKTLFYQIQQESQGRYTIMYEEQNIYIYISTQHKTTGMILLLISLSLSNLNLSE